MKLGRAQRRPAWMRWMGPAAASVLLEGAATWARSRRLGGNIVVRCRQGHLFSTIWIPAVSLKSLRLGPWRYQRCPVGHHWSLVTPVRSDALTVTERQEAAGRSDIRIP
jgi:hypothetical protein